MSSDIETILLFSRRVAASRGADGLSDLTLALDALPLRCGFSMSLWSCLLLITSVRRSADPLAPLLSFPLTVLIQRRETPEAVRTGCLCALAALHARCSFTDPAVRFRVFMWFSRVSFRVRQPLEC